MKFIRATQPSNLHTFTLHLDRCTIVRCEQEVNMDAGKEENMQGGGE